MTRGLALVAAVLLIALPWGLSSYQLGLLTKMLIFAVFAMSLNLILGYAGLPSLGHAAYFGVAAYTTALLSLRLTPNFWLDFAAGLIAAAITAALFGLLALRAQGSYLLMITLALAQVLWGIAFGWRSLTGGDDGLPGITRPAVGPWRLGDGISFYYFILVVFSLAVALMWLVVRSPFGRALVGIRESARRMEVLGYNVWLHKYVAFVLAGTLAGLSGGDGVDHGDPGRRRHAARPRRRQRRHRFPRERDQRVHRALATDPRPHLRGRDAVRAGRLARSAARTAGGGQNVSA